MVQKEEEEMKHDISNRADIERLVDTFYEKVKADDTIGYIFNDIAKVDWPAHLPRMYAFWAGLLLDEEGFTGNPMAKHIALNRLVRLAEPEFDQWLNLFNETVDELFQGKIADEAKRRAASIAMLMLRKIRASES